MSCLLLRCFRGPQRGGHPDGGGGHVEDDVQAEQDLRRPAWPEARRRRPSLQDRQVQATLARPALHLQPWAEGPSLERSE